MDALERLRAAIPDAARDIRLRDAVLAAAAAAAGPAVVEDARAAAALMAMNNVYYRFRHMVGKPVYGEKPAGLRMNRLMQPATSRTDFELMALAVSAINGCEMCVRAHEKTVTAGGLTPDRVNDAVRIAATIYAAAVALEAGEPGEGDPSVIEVSAQSAWGRAGAVARARPRLSGSDATAPIPARGAASAPPLPGRGAPG